MKFSESECGTSRLGGVSLVSTQPREHGCCPRVDYHTRPVRSAPPRGGVSGILSGMNPSPPIHVPVLPTEVLQWIDPQPGQIIVDGTLGGGGHTRMLAERLQGEGFVLSLDRDPRAIAAAERNLAGLPVKIAQSNYCDMADVLREIDVPAVDAVLLDIGLSSDQLADRERGFSFDSDGELDLRFNTDEGLPAWQLLQRLKENEIADLIYQFGEERFSRRIARRIVEARTSGQPIRTSAALADLVRRSVPRTEQRIDPATRTFQALRIAVNRELESLSLGLQRIPDLLKPGGKLAIISFHSLEDRPVKEAFRNDPRLEALTKKPIVASEAELAQNPRSRSAKMRVARRR